MIYLLIRTELSSILPHDLEPMPNHNRSTSVALGVRTQAVIIR